ncbi:MFS transporter [Amycolatopsis rubida]|uniref:MFS transporter n=1 Tax=Amycolatopsis rubida TaxID=112413 RepID=A0A1I5ZVL9_9PSEU|nr:MULTISPECIES: Cmx/CmrA family chloramphenicol efflux MFS transporter [Amycolatopsis]MYW96051.1 Cmx/CmrA family chloramphenicol efflux MFS transporter [Amycolatopsis rubida]NEC61042.1 MFS transporter [Amycolatopsis rubida]OAP20517.1 Inner membrane transport protein YdhP [Amycolatopsis sp. M39]SFQ60440.1 MFS transporter, DHA1 family, chloramphenicol resistance protein [Amycolatopsis rubida]
MPPAVFVLGLSIFALGTSEFMITGLLPGMATDLGVTVPDAGLLISAFAAGMVVGAPLLAVGTIRLPRRTTLLGLLAVFSTAHVLGAISGGYALLFATRIISAVACAGFWAVAAATTVNLVPEARRGQALAVLVGGLTVANVVGVPAGTLLGQHAGWRSAFWAVAALTVIAAIAVLLSVPRATKETQAPRIAEELRVFRRSRLWLALGVIALLQAMVFATFSYLAPLLVSVAGLPESAVPVVLALFGGGAVIGIYAGGKLADKHPFATLYGSLGIALAALVALAFATNPVVAVTAVLVLGAAGFAANPALNVRAYAAAGGTSTLVGASTTSAFNVGNTAGPWLGGTTISAGMGFSSVAWVSVALGALALAALTFALRLHQRDIAPNPVAV